MRMKGWNEGGSVVERRLEIGRKIEGWDEYRRLKEE